VRDATSHQIELVEEPLSLRLLAVLHPVLRREFEDACGVSDRQEREDIAQVGPRLACMKMTREAHARRRRNGPVRNRGRGRHSHANVGDGAIIDAASGHQWPGTAARATVSFPWLALAPADVAADEGAFALQQAAAR
jgi:hypothetical protein